MNIPIIDEEYRHDVYDPNSNDWFHIDPDVNPPVLIPVAYQDGYRLNTRYYKDIIAREDTLMVNLAGRPKSNFWVTVGDTTIAQELVRDLKERSAVTRELIGRYFAEQEVAQ